MQGLSILANVLSFTVAALAAVLYAKLLYRAGMKLDSKSAFRHIRCVLACVVLLALANVGNIVFGMAPNLSWSLPVFVEYHQLRATWLITRLCTVFIFLSISILAIRTRHRERVKLVFAAVVVIAAIEWTFWRAARPIYASLEEKMSANGVVMQSGDVSCAAASCANIATMLGVSMSERDAAELIGTTRDGTTMSQIVVGMERRGFLCRKVTLDPSNAAMIQPPAILTVDHPATGPESHAVALMGVADGVFEIWDPLVGKEMLSLDELRGVWRGKAMELALP